MTCSYAGAWSSLADVHGNLSRQDASTLLTEHGWSLPDLAVNQRGVAWEGLKQMNLEALIQWLAS